MAVTDFPARTGNGHGEPDTDDLIAVVGFEMSIRMICKACGPFVLVCLGKLHEVVCPHCRRAYRLSFLHFDPADASTHAPDGTPQLGITIAHRRLDGVIIPSTFRTPPIT